MFVQDAVIMLDRLTMELRSVTKVHVGVDKNVCCLGDMLYAGGV